MEGCPGIALEHTELVDRDGLGHLAGLVFHVDGREVGDFRKACRGASASRPLSVKVRPRNEALDVRVENVAALAGLLSMGLDLSREAARLAGLANAMQIGTLRPEEQALAPRRRVRSPGIELGL